MASRPTLTVLLCVYNGEAHLRPALDSILGQSLRDFEFLIIDDASTDRTPDILANVGDARVRVVRNEANLGLTASLNRGLSLAAGEFIARHDADDLAHPTRLVRQADFLAAHHAVAAVGSQVRLIDGGGRSLGNKDYPLTHRSIQWMHLFDNALAHSAVMFRKSAVVRAGGYDERFRASQDYELWSRLGERHAMANLPERLVTLRILPASVTRTHRRPEQIREIQAMHYSRIFPGQSASAEALDLIGLFRIRVTGAVLQRFVTLMGDLLAAYQAAWPESRMAGDFARTLALQHERIGYNLLPEERSAACREIWRAIRIWPPRLFSLPWIRLTALTVLGARARAIHERLSGHGRQSAQKL